MSRMRRGRQSLAYRTVRYPNPHAPAAGPCRLHSVTAGCVVHRPVWGWRSRRGTASPGEPDTSGTAANTRRWTGRCQRLRPGWSRGDR
jgi:hypothetical protein